MILHFSLIPGAGRGGYVAVNGSGKNVCREMHENRGGKQSQSFSQIKFPFVHTEYVMYLKPMSLSTLYWATLSKYMKGTKQT